MTTWAIVPVKSPDRAKRRLAAALTADQRRRLMGAMLDDVLSCLGQVRGLAGVAMVTPEPAGGRAGVRWIGDPGRGLNEALAGAAGVLERDGATAVLMVAADTPLATPREIECLLAAGRASPVVVVPDLEETGTNALLLSPPRVMLPAFGESSLSRHVARAKGLGIAPKVLRLPGLGFDIDSPGDLEALRQRLSHRQAYEFLRPFVGVAE